MTDSGERYGEKEGQEADRQQQVNNLVARSGLGPRLGRQALPVLLVLAQIIAGDGYGGFEGLGLVTASSFLEEFVVATTSAMAMWLFIMIFMVGFSFVCWLGCTELVESLVAGRTNSRA